MNRTGWILFASAFALLAALIAHADTKRCPSTEGECSISIQATDSPDVSHTCLLPEGDAPAFDLVACVPVSAGMESVLVRTIATGSGDQCFRAFAYREDEKLFSGPSADSVCLFDLGRPTIGKITVTVTVEVEP